MKTYYSKKLKRKVTIPDYDDHTGEMLENGYSDCLKVVVAKIETLRREIPKHGAGKITWPIIGDLQHINELLDEIIKFMGVRG